MNTRGLSRCVQSLSLKNLFFFHRSVFVCKDRAKSATFQKFSNYFSFVSEIFCIFAIKYRRYIVNGAS